MARREAGHAGEEGGVCVGEQQGVASPAEEKRGDEEPGCAAQGRVRGEERHQQGLGDGMAGVVADGEREQIDEGRQCEDGQERAGDGRVCGTWVHAAAVSSAAGTPCSGTGTGCQPGPRNTRPARSRQLVAAFRSLAMATYSWVATLIGLNVLMFLVNP